MLATKAIITLAFCFLYQQLSLADPLSLSRSDASDELRTCEEQLSKYRRFLLQAILSFEDVCDAYNARPLNAAEALYRAAHDQELAAGGAAGTPPMFRNYQAPEQRSEIWAFFKLLMAQFNDLEFTNIIRDAVIERCRIKSQLQRDEKRNSVVLGKKQRFHSWGGKRSQVLGGGGGGGSGDERSGEHGYFI